MSVNLFAFLQTGARTITVNYQGYGNDYTYLTTDNSIGVGCFVVVPCKPKDGPERLSVAVVVAVDNTVKLDPKDTLKYKWVIQKIDLSAANELKAREQQVLNLLEESQRKRLVKDMLDELSADVTAKTWHEVITIVDGASDAGNT